MLITVLNGQGKVHREEVQVSRRKALDLVSQEDRSDSWPRGFSEVGHPGPEVDCGKVTNGRKGEGEGKGEREAQLQSQFSNTGTDRVRK